MSLDLESVAESEYIAETGGFRVWEKIALAIGSVIGAYVTWRGINWIKAHRG
ncbi:MAG: hypothetical protein M0R06_08165 [Sphaerochaeta sp.]|jgi:hypothetical protein|nr:hypothetical protein [Sphaerochaeta sp.]